MDGLIGNLLNDNLIGYLILAFINNLIDYLIDTAGRQVNTRKDKCYFIWYQNWPAVAALPRSLKS